jgi:hypothetical protein
LPCFDCRGGTDPDAVQNVLQPDATKTAPDDPTGTDIRHTDTDSHSNKAKQN